jgi:hypothetical protein
MLNLKMIIGSTRPGRAADRAQLAAKVMLDDLAWWGTTLQRARRDGDLPPATRRQMAGVGARR